MSTVELEQVQETYSVVLGDKCYSLISTYTAFNDYTQIDILLEGEPVIEGSDEYNEVMNSYNLSQEE